MKKFLTSIFASIMLVFGCVGFSSCTEFEEALDLAFENQLLRVENEELKTQVEDLETELDQLNSELANLKFELTFPNGLLTESYTLNSLTVIRNIQNPEGSVYAVRADGTDVVVTINSGTYDAGSGSLYNIAVWAHNNSKVVINDGIFKTGADVNGEANHVVYAAGNSVVEINGGWFESVGVNAPMMINCQDGKGTIIIKGGTFVNFDPSNCVSEGEGTNFVAEGYIVEKETVDGVDYYKVVKAPEVQDEIEE